MIVVTVRNKGAKFELVVNDPNALFEVLTLLESSPAIDQYKVIDSDFGQIKNFYSQYGWDNAPFTKCTTGHFNWPNSWDPK